MDHFGNRPPPPAITAGAAQSWSGPAPSSLQEQGEQATHNLPIVAVILAIILLVSFIIALIGFTWRWHNRRARFAQDNSASRRGSDNSDKVEKGEAEGPVKVEAGHKEGEGEAGVKEGKAEQEQQQETVHKEEEQVKDEDEGEKREEAEPAKAESSTAHVV